MRASLYFGGLCCCTCQILGPIGKRGNVWACVRASARARALKAGHGDAPVSGILNRSERGRARGEREGRRRRGGYYSRVCSSQTGCRRGGDGGGGKSVNQRLMRFTFLLCFCMCLQEKRDRNGREEMRLKVWLRLVLIVSICLSIYLSSIYLSIIYNLSIYHLSIYPSHLLVYSFLVGEMSATMAQCPPPCPYSWHPWEKRE